MRLEDLRCQSLLRPSDVTIIAHDTLALCFACPPGILAADLLAEENCLSWSASLSIIDQVLDALSVVHAVGLTHGELSPSRIFVDRAGLVGWRGCLFEVGAAKATPNAIGEDLRAACLTFLHLVTGRSLRGDEPFLQSTARLLTVLRDPAAWPRVPVAVAEVVAEALHALPASAQELRARLRSVAPPTRPLERHL
jgi:serine/threonine protein kinase